MLWLSKKRFWENYRAPVSIKVPYSERWPDAQGTGSIRHPPYVLSHSVPSVALDIPQFSNYHLKISDLNSIFWSDFFIAADYLPAHRNSQHGCGTLIRCSGNADGPKNSNQQVELFCVQISCIDIEPVTAMFYSNRRPLRLILG